MVLKLYGFGHSTNTQRVVLVLNLKQVPFEYINVDMSKGEHKAPENVKHQPFGALPYIDDDGFLLYESRAICHYIVTKYPEKGPALIPTDLKANAIYNQGSSIEVSSFDSSAGPLVYEKLFKPYQGLTADEHAVKMFETTLLGNLAVYEKILSTQKYIGGDTFTLADLHHIPYLTLLPQIGFDAVDKTPALSKWAKEILALPEWQAILKDGMKSTA